MFLCSTALTEQPTATAYMNDVLHFCPSTISLHGPHGKVTTTPVPIASFVSKLNKRSFSLHNFDNKIIFARKEGETDSTIEISGR
jgi:hypothetical protein